MKSSEINSLVYPRKALIMLRHDFFQVGKSTTSAVKFFVYFCRTCNTFYFHHAYYYYIISRQRIVLYSFKLYNCRSNLIKLFPIYYLS